MAKPRGPGQSTPDAGARSAAMGMLLYCSFCGLSQKEVRQLVTGPACAICDICIYLANGLAHGGDVDYGRHSAPWFDPAHPMNSPEPADAGR